MISGITQHGSTWFKCWHAMLTGAMIALTGAGCQMPASCRAGVCAIAICLMVEFTKPAASGCRSKCHGHREGRLKHRHILGMPRWRDVRLKTMPAVNIQLYPALQKPCSRGVVLLRLQKPHSTGTETRNVYESSSPWHFLSTTWVIQIPKEWEFFLHFGTFLSWIGLNNLFLYFRYSDFNVLMVTDDAQRFQFSFGNLF